MKKETQLSVLQEIRDLLKKESTVASVPEAIKAAILALACSCGYAIINL